MREAFSSVFRPRLSRRPLLRRPTYQDTTPRRVVRRTIYREGQEPEVIIEQPEEGEETEECEVTRPVRAAKKTPFESWLEWRERRPSVVNAVRRIFHATARQIELETEERMKEIEEEKRRLKEEREELEREKRKLKEKVELFSRGKHY
ncbi:hypothetical protein J7L06_01540 [Candidatus Bathyarchaeota archaeon]|nr:hypothetical protein [Candidatus Bathyarchaeota archaeon]